MTAKLVFIEEKPSFVAIVVVRAKTRLTLIVLWRLPSRVRWRPLVLCHFSDFLHQKQPEIMDPFEVRMQFLALLRRLNASVLP